MKKENGSIQVLILLLLVTGLVIGLVLVGKQTNIIPKAYVSNTLSRSDLTTSPSATSQPTVAVIAVENAINTPEIDKIVAKEFYKTHEDEYDFLAISFDVNRRHYYHTSVKNNVQGIGSNNWYLDSSGIPRLDTNPIFDHTTEYGSNGKLLGIGVIGPIADYIGTNRDPSWMEEVIGHQFGVFVGSPHIPSDPLHINSDESDGHWNNCMHFPREDPTQKYWKGNLWKDNGDGTWTRVDQDLNDFSKPLKFEPLMLYFMGFLPPEKVPNAILLEPEGGFRNGLCFPGKTIKATPREISVQDIIQRYGPRIPSYNNSQKEFSVAFILIVEKGKQPTPGAVETMTNWAKRFPEAIREATTYTNIATPSPTPFVCTPCAADIKKDSRNQVNASDYAILSSCFGKALDYKLSNGIACAVADINIDESINQADYDCLKSVYFQKC